MNQTLSPEVQALLRCPLSQQNLHLATAEELSAFSADFPEGAWITEDRSRAYPIRDDFPILVPDESLQVRSGTSD
ncbi:MAG: hypothetical protein P1U81_06935 [Verrucomicrobiales bacterium]|nr:hypothetical protein [Verrucomicrobiales bacterium]